MTAAVSILRVSTKRQLNEGDGIENQRRANDAYIERQRYRKTKEIVLAESADLDIRERCDLDAALREVLDLKKQGLAEVVVLYKSDRLSRGGGEQYYPIKALLRRHGLRLEFSTEHIDDSASGELLEHVLTGIARFENRVRVDRTVGVEKILTRDGYWCRGAPTGFVNARDGQGKPILVPTPDTKQWELLGYGLKKQLTGLYRPIDVAVELRDKGFVTSGGKPLYKQVWARICRSPVYGGLLCGKWTDGQFVRAKFNGPLTPGEWHELQRVLDGKVRVALTAPRQQLHPELPLRRFLRCPKCDKIVRGYASVGGHGGRYLYYDCRHPACAFRVAADQAHAAFTGLLREVTPEPKLLVAFRGVVLDQWQQQKRLIDAERAASRKGVHALREEKRSLVALMKKAIDDPALLTELRSDFERVERELSLTMLAQEGEAETYDPEAVVGHCIHLLQNIVELWPKWPVEAQSRVQRLVFPDGVSYAELTGCRTPRLSPVYAAFGGSGDLQSGLAGPSGRVTNSTIESMIEWHRQLQTLSQDFPDLRAA
jgi:site-specific DNA recombinase